MGKTQFAYPVQKICGKISRHSRVIHACTASGAQVTYLQGDRDYAAHPVSVAEKAGQSLFKRREAVVASRIKKTASTYAADMAAYQSARQAASTPAERAATQTFRGYLWSLVKAEITE